MSSYIKPQSPLYNEAVDTYIYPLTTVDQIVLSNGERLNESYFGKGIELNYSIIGGLEEPENPTENMIWVQTDQPITGHIFRNHIPESAVQGTILIYTGHYSRAAFDRMIINDITTDEIYPISTKQYLNGAWEDKYSTIYQNKKWVDLIAYILYHSNPYQGWTSSNTAGLVITFEAGGMRLTRPSSAYGACNSNILFDISAYNVVKIRYSQLSSGGRVQLMAHSSKMGQNIKPLILKEDISATGGEAAIDLSGVKSVGKIYIGLGVFASNAASVLIEEVWFE